MLLRFMMMMMLTQKSDTISMMVKILLMMLNQIIMIFVKIKINHLFQQHSLFVSASAVVFSLSLFSSSHHLQGFHLPAIGTSSIAASGDSTRFSTCFPLGAFSFSLPHSWDCLTSTWFLNQLMEYWAIEMISIPKRKTQTFTLIERLKQILSVWKVTVWQEMRARNVAKCECEILFRINNLF